MNTVILSRRKLKSIYIPNQRPIQYCTDCGNYYDKNYSYCTDCGIKSIYLFRKEKIKDIDPVNVSSK